MSASSTDEAAQTDVVHVVVGVLQGQELKESRNQSQSAEHRHVVIHGSMSSMISGESLRCKQLMPVDQANALIIITIPVTS